MSIPQKTKPIKVWAVPLRIEYTFRKDVPLSKLFNGNPVDPKPEAKTSWSGVPPPITRDGVSLAETADVKAA